MHPMQDDSLCCPECHVCMYISKHALDVFLLPANNTTWFDTGSAGLRKPVRYRLRHHLRLIALGATGRYHRKANEALYKAKLEVAVVNPFGVREFVETTLLKSA